MTLASSTYRATTCAFFRPLAVMRARRTNPSSAVSRAAPTLRERPETLHIVLASSPGFRARRFRRRDTEYHAIASSIIMPPEMTPPRRGELVDDAARCPEFLPPQFCLLMKPATHLLQPTRQGVTSRPDLAGLSTWYSRTQHPRARRSRQAPPASSSPPVAHPPHSCLLDVARDYVSRLPSSRGHQGQQVEPILGLVLRRAHSHGVP